MGVQWTTLHYLKVCIGHPLEVLGRFKILNAGHQINGENGCRGFPKGFSIFDLFEVMNHEVMKY